MGVFIKTAAGFKDKSYLQSYHQHPHEVFLHDHSILVLIEPFQDRHQVAHWQLHPIPTQIPLQLLVADEPIAILVYLLEQLLDFDFGEALQKTVELFLSFDIYSQDFQSDL